MCVAVLTEENPGDKYYLPLIFNDITSLHHRYSFSLKYLLGLAMQMWKTSSTGRLTVMDMSLIFACYCFLLLFIMMTLLSIQL